MDARESPAAALEGNRDESIFCCHAGPAAAVARKLDKRRHAADSDEHISPLTPH